MPLSPLPLLALSFVLGLRHALDVDHLAAVSTIVSQRRGVWRSSLAGGVWGLGHTVALMMTALVVVALRTEIPPALAQLLELAVALMLIGLGAQVLWTLARGGTLHHHVHAHGGVVHVHPHLHGVHHGSAAHHVEHGGAAATHDDGGSWRRPLIVGLVHGLAGSAGLMMVGVATIPSRALALVYVLVFGLGSIGGMVGMSTLLGLPLALAAERFAGVVRAVRLGTALASVTVGIVSAWQVGVAAGVLL
jgi:ABC-type nickel/cobalt efflux system permease component RcnA